MNFDKKELDAILDALEFGDYYNLHDNVFYDQIVCPFKSKYKKEFFYDYGATKGVLAFKNLGFVIKIPFVCNDEWDFSGADCENGWDYCQVEVDKYQMASTSGVERCFAETQYITSIDGYPIYMQEYATMFERGDSASSCHNEEDLEKVKSLCKSNNYDCFNTIWLSDVFNFFGEHLFYKLMNFIDDCDIRDLHNGNIGYIGMRPVLVDYSSFND